jgi:hypothetical protein
VLGRVFSGLRGIPFELHDVSLASSLLGWVRPRQNDFGDRTRLTSGEIAG